MKLPSWLWIPICAVILLGCVGFGLGRFGDPQLLGDIANFALILTLAALLVYVYYTYLLAKDAWTPSASFALQAFQSDPYQFHFLIRNHSKVSLNCWCNLNATVDGKAVSLGGFYSGESSFDLQPFGGASGHFSIKDILAKAGTGVGHMKVGYFSGNPRSQLRLDIEFWYNPVGSKTIVRNPRQPHFFHFGKKQMIADF